MRNLIFSFLAFDLIQRVLGNTLNGLYGLIGLGEDTKINSQENTSIKTEDIEHIKSELGDIKFQLEFIKEKINRLPNFMILFNAYISIMSYYKLIIEYSTEKNAHSHSKTITHEILKMYSDYKRLLKAIDTTEELRTLINMLDAASSVHLWALERYDKEFLAQGSKDKKEFLQYLYNYALKKFQDSEIELGITALLEYYEFVRITDAEELFNVLKAYFFDISRSSQFRNIIDFILLDPSNQFLKKHQINFIKFDNFLHEYVEDVLPKLLTVDSDEAIMTYNKIFHTRNFIHDTINKYDLHLKTKQELLFIFNESERLVANKSIIVKILDFTHKLNIHLDSKFDLYKRILIYIKDKGYDRHPNSEIFLFVACIQYEIEKLNKELNKEFLLKINKELIKGIPLLVKYLVFESNLFIFDNSNNFHFLLPITIEVALNWYKDIPIKTANSMSGFNWNNAPTLGTDNKKILINDHNWSVAQYRLPQKWLSGYKISRIDGGKFLETLTGEKNFWSIQKLPLQNVAGENIKESIFFKKTISPSPLKEKEIYGLSA